MSEPTCLSEGLVPLVACPFCGASKGYTLRDGDTYRWWLVMCAGCGAGVAECRSDSSTKLDTPKPQRWPAADEDWNEAGKHAQQLRTALQQADTIMGHDDEHTAWRERWQHLWPWDGTSKCLNAEPAPQDAGHQAMWPQMIAALAAIDAALGLPEDGCNSTAMTLAKLKQWRAALLKADKVLDGSVTLLRRAIRADATGGRYSYIQARDGAMLEATGPISQCNNARAAIRNALGA